MTDKPEERPEERRRTGPLGDDGETEVNNETETRRETSAEQDEGATRPIPARSSDEEAPAEEERRSSRFRRSSRRNADEDTGAGDSETRVIRTPGSEATRPDSSYPRGYFEAADEREDRLRDMYGGVDWLASFFGFVFAVVAAAVFSVVAGLILVPLGLSLDLGSGVLGPAAITGLVLVGILIFLTYFLAGYVAGRLARFDGGRNGAMTVLWSLVIGAVLLAVGGFLPGGFFQAIKNFIQENLLPTIGSLLNLGIIGLVVIIAALLIAVLGGFLGGRFGSHYHRDIDRTT